MNMRKVLFWTHLCVGVGAGLIILSMCVTGTIMAFEEQIVDFAEHSLQKVSPPAADTTRLPLDVLSRKVLETRPHSKLGMVLLRPDAESSVVMGFGKEGSIYVNPYTAEILGSESKTHKFMHSVEDFHRRLGSGDIGRRITGAAALCFLGLSLSGFYLWLKKSVYAFQKGLRGKARDWNWHNVIGFWSLPFLILITSTGAVMSYSWANTLLYRLAGSEPPRAPAERPVSPPSDRSTRPDEKPLASLDLFLAQALQKKSAWESIMIRLPQKPGAPVNVLIEEPNRNFPRRSQLSMNASTGEVLKWEPYEEWNRGRLWRTWAGYLHTGQAGGLAGQCIAFLAACGGLIIVWTGFALAWHRYASSRKKRLKRTAGDSPNSAI